MTNMVNKAQGFGLSLLTKMASSDGLDTIIKLTIYYQSLKQK